MGNLSKGMIYELAVEMGGRAKWKLRPMVSIRVGPALFCRGMENADVDRNRVQETSDSVNDARNSSVETANGWLLVGRDTEDE